MNTFYKESNNILSYDMQTDECKNAKDEISFFFSEAEITI